MRRNRNIMLLLATLMAFVAVNTAYAHRPVTAGGEGIITIPDPSTSYAYYEMLDGGDVDVYTVSAEASQFFHAGINIPQIDGLETYGVSLALLGPGLPALANEALPALPDDHDAESGAHSHNGDAAWSDRLGMDSLTGMVVASHKSEDFHEPFTQTNYWGRQVVELNLPETGTYYLLVWHPQGMAGKYVMDTGRAEVFGPGDLFRFPIWWLQTHIYFEHTAGLIAGAAGLLLLVIGALALPRLRRRGRFLQ